MTKIYCVANNCKHNDNGVCGRENVRLCEYPVDDDVYCVEMHIIKKRKVICYHCGWQSRRQKSKHVFTKYPYGKCIKCQNKMEIR